MRVEEEGHTMAHVLGGLINVVAVALLVPLLMLRWIVTALRKPVDSRVLCFFHPYWCACVHGRVCV